MFTRVLLLGLATVCCFAQLSPGDLARVHEDLEGLGNCTTCHTFGSKDFAPNCLSCHKLLDERIKAKQGLHAGKDFQNCASCHSEHQGKAFELIHWPDSIETFDHKKTGFELLGKHNQQACRDCHKADFLHDEEAIKAAGKDGNRTFLGLNQDCLSCHQDEHRGKLDKDCLSCHNMDGWQITDFDHNQTAYALEGAHGQLSCDSCHVPQQDAMGFFKKYKPTPHENCLDCHGDQHQGQLVDDCRSCHDMEQFAPASLFDHNQTRYPLTGKHRQVSCKSCHHKETFAGGVMATRYKPIDGDQCTDCHEDVHDQRLGNDCTSCHQTNGWDRILGELFDHNQTRFPLVGKHQQTECKECHRESLQIDRFEACEDCHNDVHRGQFDHFEDCASCHDEHGFVPANYSLAQHQQSNFPLKGAHLATPCFACHASASGEKGGVYHFPDTQCKVCHEDPHNGDTDAYMNPAGDCLTCHTLVNWRESVFDHDRTEFPLKGRHRETACSDCHAQSTMDETLHFKFNGLVDACGDCHEDRHDGQFPEKDCGSCHKPDNWQATLFDHNRDSSFSLEGAHLDVTCTACHKKNDMGRVHYKPIDPACATCHIK